MIRIKGFVSHAFDDEMYEGGREAFKTAIETLVNRACGELSTDKAQVRHELFFEAQGYGRPLMVEVRNQIRECDFLIADITPDPSGEVNSNVMYEIGYAMALEKRLLVIRHQTEAPHRRPARWCLRQPSGHPRPVPGRDDQESDGGDRTIAPRRNQDQLAP